MSSKFARRRLQYFRNLGKDCHLCGLPIPEWLVKPNHPLSPTSDHVVPRALGGDNCAANRRPAHAVCNHFRGVRDLSPGLSEDCRFLSLAAFTQIALPTGRRWRTVRRLLRKFNRRQV